ncbi:MAG: rhomboid family intramembrane serine protease [Planctomycetaceae bacterium]|nr:rhomboid family intramembrane serine protease [Planctomycetaceae bacterium]MCA9042702.1 rhomboid family intramembrane serine protease [Planctomycetaceae bacterium]
MGLDNREYMRDEKASTNWGDGRPAPWDYDIVTTLIVANVCVFILQQLTSYGDFGEESTVSDWMQLSPELVLRGQVWRLTTYDFLHAPKELLHIFVNMFVLWMTGSRLQARMGWREFLAFYLVAGVVSGAGYIAWCAVSGQWNPCIGASGAVAGLIVLYAIYWPEQKWYIYGIFPISSRWLAILYAGFDLYPLIRELTGLGRGDNVAHAAHLAGMAFALVYALRGWHFMDLISRFTGWKTTSHLNIYDDPDQYHPPRQQTQNHSKLTSAEQQRMEDLLAKISLNGEGSLTDEERRFMNDVSRRLRNR